MKVMEFFDNIDKKMERLQDEVDRLGVVNMRIRQGGSQLREEKYGATNLLRLLANKHYGNSTLKDLRPSIEYFFKKAGHVIADNGTIKPKGRV